MDDEQIEAWARAALQAREVTWTAEHPLGAVRVVLRAPSRHEMRMQARELGLDGPMGGVSLAVLKHELVLRALQRWEGVRLGHVLPQHAEAQSPLPLSPRTARMLLDAQPDWADEMGDALMQRVQLRTSAIEADAGN